MQKSKTTAKKSFTPREVYESLLGRRVSDTKWSRLSRACELANLPLEQKTLKLLVDLGRLSSHVVYSVLSLKQTDVEPVSAESSTGRQVIQQIREMGINPDISTMYRWFHRIKTTFALDMEYDAPTVSLVKLQALIYKHKKRRVKNGQN